jgi:hypothetical protein
MRSRLLGDRDLRPLELSEAIFGNLLSRAV